MLIGSVVVVLLIFVKILHKPVIKKNISTQTDPETMVKIMWKTYEPPSSPSLVDSVIDDNDVEFVYSLY